MLISGAAAEHVWFRNNTAHVLDEAEGKIDRDRVYDVISHQPKQYHIVIFSIISLADKDKPIFTREIYNFYKNMCDKLRIRPLTQRRISDIIAEYDMLGIVNAKIISKGRYGRTREIYINLADDMRAKVKTLLESELNLK